MVFEGKPPQKIHEVRNNIMVLEGKQPQKTHEVRAELTVKIAEADLFQRCKVPNYSQIVVWTNTGGRQYSTKFIKVSKRNTCRFDTGCMIPLESHAQYLYIELLREPPSSASDIPTTSNGFFVMGRAKVKLCARNCTGRTLVVDLVGLNSDRCIVKKGTLELSLQLFKYRVRD